jgi:hypothetical protein
MAAIECFHVLMPNARMLKLAQAKESKLSRTCYPTVVRRRLLESERRRRLHGRHYEWLGTDRHVARQLCERGQETTPAEVAEVRCKTIRMVREKAAAEGVRVPTDDHEWLAKGRE